MDHEPTVPQYIVLLTSSEYSLLGHLTYSYAQLDNTRRGDHPGGHALLPDVAGGTSSAQRGGAGAIRTATTGRRREEQRYGEYGCFLRTQLTLWSITSSRCWTRGKEVAREKRR